MISESIRRIGDQRPERESEGDDTHICGSERHTAYDAASSTEPSGSDVKDRQVRPGPMAVIADLRQRHYISDPTSKLLRELRRVRNAVAHEEEEPTSAPHLHTPNPLTPPFASSTSRLKRCAALRNS